MTYYKCLTAEGRGPYSGCKWYLPVLQLDGTYRPGRWMPRIKKPLVRCRVGYHGCDETQLINWLDATIYELEYDGEPEGDGQKYWGARARLIRPLAAWNDRSARLLACRIAEDVLPIFERHRPSDNRPRTAIETARKYADGQASVQELAAAWDAAWDAVRDAVWDAAWDAVWDAARDAARAAILAKYNSWLWETLREAQ